MKKIPRVKTNCKWCGKEYLVKETLVKAGKRQFCSPACGSKHYATTLTEEKKAELREFLHKVGPEHPSWKGGRKVRPDGYIQIWVGKDHPYRDRHGYVMEHRLVMEKHLGRYLLPHEIVHHKDRNPSNNSIENLELVENHRMHVAIHQFEKYGGKIAKSGWSSIHEHCKQCKSTKYKHQARGLCTSCYMKQYKAL